MGYNMSNDIALGQLGSGFTDNTAQVTPPAGKVIIAITMMHDAKFEALVVEKVTDTTTFKGPIDVGDSAGNAGVAFGGTPASPKPEINSFGTDTGVLANGGNNLVVTSDNVFPKGLTIYGRWRSFTLHTGNSAGGVIAYYGK